MKGERDIKKERFIEIKKGKAGVRFVGRKEKL